MDELTRPAPSSLNLGIVIAVVAAFIGITITATTTFINMSARVSVLEAARSTDQAFYSETRSALDRISGQIADLRVLYATGDKIAVPPPHR